MIARRSRQLCRKVVFVLGCLYVFTPIQTQTYFSKAYDINSCYNEARVIGQISDSTAIVSGLMTCGSPRFHGYGAFEISLFDGTVISNHFTNRFNIASNRANTVEQGYMLGGTGSFIPQKGIWKVDARGNVLDSVLFNHPDTFNYTEGLAAYDGGYVATIVYDNASRYDMIQVDSELDIIHYYPQYIDSPPGEVPNRHFEGPDGELYFSVCRDPTFGRCDDLQIHRFQPDGNHELIYAVLDEGRQALFDGIVLPADDSSFYYIWNKDTSYYDQELQEDFAVPGIVSKISYTGERLWDTYFWPYNGFVTEAFTTRNGDIVLTGAVYLQYDYQPGAIPDRQLGGGYIARVSANGEVLWERKIYDLTHCNTLSQCYSAFYNGAELPNGDLIFSGRVDTLIPGAPAIVKNTNSWVVKTDANGCLTPNCGLVQALDTTFYTATTTWQTPPQSSMPLQISPNPTASYNQIRIELPEGNTSSASGQLRVINSLGQVIETANGIRLPYQQSIQQWAAGHYTIQWLNEQTGKVWNGRVVVVE